MFTIFAIEKCLLSACGSIITRGTSFVSQRLERDHCRGTHRLIEPPNKTPTETQTTADDARPAGQPCRETNRTVAPPGTTSTGTQTENAKPAGESYRITNRVIALPVTFSTGTQTDDAKLAGQATRNSLTTVNDSVPVVGHCTGKIGETRRDGFKSGLPVAKSGSSGLPVKKSGLPVKISGLPIKKLGLPIPTFSTTKPNAAESDVTERTKCMVTGNSISADGDKPAIKKIASRIPVRNTPIAPSTKHRSPIMLKVRINSTSPRNWVNPHWGGPRPSRSRKIKNWTPTSAMD